MQFPDLCKRSKSHVDVLVLYITPRRVDYSTLASLLTPWWLVAHVK